jgi:hypothetical protein
MAQANRDPLIESNKSDPAGRTEIVNFVGVTEPAHPVIDGRCAVPPTPRRWAGSPPRWRRSRQDGERYGIG